MPELCSLGQRAVVRRDPVSAVAAVCVYAGASANTAHDCGGIFGESGFLYCTKAEKTVEAFCVCPAVKGCDVVGVHGYCVQSVPCAAKGRLYVADIYGDSPVDDGAAWSTGGCAFVETAAACAERLNIVHKAI